MSTKIQILESACDKLDQVYLELKGIVNETTLKRLDDAIVLVEVELRLEVEEQENP